MTEIFIEKNPPYHLRSSNILQMPKARTVRYGLESISFLGCKLWHGISTDIKQSLNISIFKKRIKEWKGDDCNCRLCKTFIAQVGFLNQPCSYLKLKIVCKYVIYVHMYIFRKIVLC